MARIVFSGLIDSIRGSIGGTTFQKNGHGWTVKKKPSPVVPRSNFQQIQQSFTKEAVASWRTLTDATRSSWNSWANTYPQPTRNNPSSSLTGYEVFVRSQVLRLLAGMAVKTDNPDFVLLNDNQVTVTTVAVDPGITPEMAVNFTFPVSNVGWSLLLFLSPPFLNPTSFIGSRTRFMVATNDADTSINITDQYIEHFGAVPPYDENLFTAVQAKMFNPANGQITARTQFVIQLTAL